MTESRRVRERQVWIALTAVLATSLAWTAAVSLVLLLNVHACPVPELCVVLRALTRAIVHVGRTGGPVALGAVAATGLTLAAALHTGDSSGRTARHG